MAAMALAMSVSFRLVKQRDTCCQSGSVPIVVRTLRRASRGDGLSSTASTMMQTCCENSAVMYSVTANRHSSSFGIVKSCSTYKFSRVFGMVAWRLEARVMGLVT